MCGLLRPFTRMSRLLLDPSMGCDRWKVHTKEHAVRKAFQATATHRWRNVAAAAAFGAWQAAIVWRRHLSAASADALANWQRRMLTEVRHYTARSHYLSGCCRRRHALQRSKTVKLLTNMLDDSNSPFASQRHSSPVSRRASCC